METKPTAVQLKLQHLSSCVDDELWEDVAAHLCDLLEHCRDRIIKTRDGEKFPTLSVMVRTYGKGR